MKTLLLSTALVGTLLVVTGDRQGSSPAPSAPRLAAIATPVAAPAIHTEAIAPATLTQVVQQYCVVCHNDQLLTGNLSLQAFSVENAPERAATAEKMIRKLRAGMMPPPGIPRPGGDTLTTLVETLESVVDKAVRANPNLGVRRFQRLNQAEYERVIHDLLSLDVKAAQWLPPDVIMASFDNMSAAQGFSTTLLDSYLRASTEVSRLAIGNPGAPSFTTKYANKDEVSQHAWDHIEGTPFGTRGGMVVTQDFPADGEYVFEINTKFGTGNETAMEDLDISIDGESVATLMLVNNNDAEQIPDGNGDKFGPHTEPIFVRAGQHQVSAAFVDVVDGPYEDRFSAPLWSGSGKGMNYGTTELTHLTELMITGPHNIAGVSETESRKKIFTCNPTAREQQRSCAQSILSGLATNAYRRPLKSDDVAALMKFYDEGAVDGFEIGVRTGLQAILVSPEFLFRFEREPRDAPRGEIYRLSDMDLASRLSFFLWASAPDQELISVAERGRLSDASTLERQVKRMLADPRSEALSSRFLYLWLRLQGVGKVWPDGYLYPNFNHQLADDMVKETELLFQHMIREDKSLLDLFNADYTYINERLAQHYGIEGVVGEEFRRVQYPDGLRRGVLGHGSVLQSTSMSDRTSPVLRGKWVMEVLMGTPPPPPPPNVPAFEASPQAVGGRRLTTRERIEAHAKSPVCASCHRFIDPIGLALDNFDATGQFRIRENMAPLDTRGVFYDGTAISTSSELVQVLLKRPIPLVRNFTDRLLSYAIGRPIEYYDQPTIRAITKAAAADDYKMSSLIMGVVKSDLFQMRQTQTTAN